MNNNLKIDAEINGISISIILEIGLILVFKFAGLFLPRFCFHNNLAIAGNCRACLLEVVSVEKPVAACVTDLERNFQVWSESPFALKARENVLEILLSNHPLDCPICDQAGECDLQDQAKGFGNAFSRFFLEKRGVVDKKCGPAIKTIMTRCIHCTRCIRFSELIDGPKFGILNRGSSSEIGLYNYQKKQSKLLGNIVDLCPVGALTARSYTFKGRPWELKLINSVDPTDALGSSIYVSVKGTTIFRLSPKPNKYINGNIISDRCRYSQSADKNANRLNLIYVFCSVTKSYSKISWFRFLTNKKLKHDTTATTFLLSPELSLNTLIYLKQLSNFFFGRFDLKAMKSLSASENYYFYGFNNLEVLEQDIQSCVLFSSNLESESTILAFKLKMKYQHGLLTLFSFGFLFFASFTVNFLSILPNSVFLLLEAKRKKAVSFFFSQVAPLIIVGYSFLQNFGNYFSLLFFLKNQINSLLILKLNKFANDESFLCLNVQAYFKTVASKASVHCFNLYDNLALRKNILSCATEIFWFSPCKPFTSAATIFNFLIPTFSFFEDSNLFVSTENRFQNVHKIFSSLIDNRPIKHILSSFYFFSIEEFNTLFDVYVNEKMYKLKLSLSVKIFFLSFTENNIYTDFIPQGGLKML